MSSTPPPFQPPSGQPYGYPPRPPIPMGKKTNILFWILGGLAVIILVVVLAVAGIGYYFATKVKQAGVNSSLLKENPALAGIKMVAALNPNIEIVSIDEDAGKVVVHDKKKDKNYTVNIDDAKKGRFSFQEDGKDPVSITTKQGPNGSIDIDSGDGKTVHIGGGGPTKLPAWLPQYPEASAAKVTFSARSDEGNVGNFTFTTPDSVEKAASFYEDAFRKAGLDVTRTLNVNNGKSGAIVKGKSGHKSATAALGRDDGETTVNVTFASEK